MAIAGWRKFVLDTNCFVDASRTDAEAAAFAEFCAWAAPRLHLSTVVAAELRAGAGRAKDRRTLERQILSPYVRRGRLVFHVVNERHRRRRSMIFTTNKSLKAWGRVLHDDDVAQAIIDRVLERGRLIRLDGPSVRTLHLNLDEAMKEGSDQNAEVARISGTHTSKPFSEQRSAFFGEP
jgi:predicted nucleic acid-binding protein